jgi:hypothetical protein
VARLDAHYTPEHIAKALVGAICHEGVRVAFDPAVGSGELLQAGEARWPEAEVVGWDNDAETLRQTQRSHEEWQLAAVDFLSARSRSRSERLRRILGRVDVALVNPPFSCRGNRALVAGFRSEEVRCSTAMSFLITLDRYVALGGVIAALLPAGCMSSQRDLEAWALLERHYAVELLEEYPRGSFPSANAYVRAVLLRRLDVSGSVRDRCVERDVRGGGTYSGGTQIRARISRGTYRMFEPTSPRVGVPLVHTTNVRDGLIVGVRLRVPRPRRVLEPPAVLVQRVGRPDRGKIALVGDSSPVVISDCLFGLECSSEATAMVLRDRILEGWCDLEAEFGGSCAPYLTVRKLRDFLFRIGVECDVLTRTGAVREH